MRRSHCVLACVTVLLIGYAAFVMSRPGSLARRWLGHDLPEMPAEEEAWLEGRPLHEWVADLKDSQPAFRRQAAEVLGEAGKNIPRHKDIAEQLAGLLSDPDPSVRLAAAVALGQVYVWAKTASQQLQAAAHDEDVNVCCASLRALALILKDDDTAAGAFRRGLSDANQAVRLFSVDALAQQGSKSDRAVALLVEAMKTSDLKVRREVVKTLTGLLSPPSYTASADMVANPAPELDPNAKAAIAAADLVWGDSDQDMRLNLLRLLGKFAEATVEAREAVVRALKDPEAAVRADAATIIGLASRLAKAAEPQLLLLLEDSDHHVQARAAFALSKLQPCSKLCLPRLLQTVKNAEDRDRLVAAWALRDICSVPDQFSDEQYGDIVIALIRAGTIEDKEPDEIWKTPDANRFEFTFSSLGGDVHPRVARAMVARLVEEFKSGNTEEKAKLAEGLHLALAAIKHPGRSEWELAASELDLHAGRLGAAIQSATPLLIDALKSANHGLQFHALQCLTVIAPEAEVSVPAFCDVLRSKDFELCSLVLFNLGKLGPAAKDATPFLIELLKDKQYVFRAGVAQALGEIGPGAKEAVKPLMEFLRDCNQWDRKDVLLALEKIDPEAAKEATKE